MDFRSLIRTFAPSYNDNKNPSPGRATATMYNVYFCTGVASAPAIIMPGFKPATFDTEAEAKDYIGEQSKGKEEVDPRDNCIEGTSRECWWEIYDGDMVENPGTDDEIFHDPIYVTPTYYNE